MFQIPPSVPDISELSVRYLGFSGIILYKILGINKLTNRSILQSRINSLNHFLEQLRNRNLESEKWKLEEVQNYIHYCCHIIGIPSVSIISEQFFNFEQAEAVLCTGKIHQDSIHEILHYVWLVLSRTVHDDEKRNSHLF